MSTARDEEQPSPGRAEGRTVTAIFVGAQSSRCRDGQYAVVVVDGDRAEVAEQHHERHLKHEGSWPDPGVTVKPTAGVGASMQKPAQAASSRQVNEVIVATTMSGQPIPVGNSVPLTG